MNQGIPCAISACGDVLAASRIDSREDFLQELHWRHALGAIERALGGPGAVQRQEPRAGVELSEPATPGTPDGTASAYMIHSAAYINALPRSEAGFRLESQARTLLHEG